MLLKAGILGAAILAAASSASLAQSLPYYGPNAPADADSFGQPPSGTMPPGVPRTGYHRYGYRKYWHHHYLHRRQHDDRDR
jgi:hypothetical protein